MTVSSYLDAVLSCLCAFYAFFLQLYIHSSLLLPACTCPPVCLPIPPPIDFTCTCTPLLIEHCYYLPFICLYSSPYTTTYLQTSYLLMPWDYLGCTTYNSPATTTQTFLPCTTQTFCFLVETVNAAYPTAPPPVTPPLPRCQHTTHT